MSTGVCYTSQVKYTTSIQTGLPHHHVGNYEKFICINNSFQCYNKNEDCEEAVVEQIAAKHQKTAQDQETDEDDTIERERATNQDARKCIAGL
jgi:hypothetical protein